MDLATLEQQISTAIGQQETAGGTAGVGLSLNNPGALKYSGWEAAYGATQTPSGFASFPSIAAGWSALADRVNQLVQSGASVAGLIHTWAPPADGNTNNDARTNQIASVTKLDPNTPIASQVGSAIATTAGSAAGTIGNAVASVLIPGWGSWARIATFVVGLVCVIAGLFMLKSTQVVVQTARDTYSKGAELAAAVSAE